MISGSYEGQLDQLHRALRRKQDLLQRLREQHMLEDLNRPHTRGGSQRQYESHFTAAPHPLPPLPLHPPPVLSSMPPPPPALPLTPHTIQQTLSQQPATMVQQLPSQQPLITQIPPPPPCPAPRSTKEDMVELMLMRNAQMNQIMMHNMMLKVMPPVALSPPGPPSAYLGQACYQEDHTSVRTDVKPRGSAVHHHHHHHHHHHYYGPTPAAPQLPPINSPTCLSRVSSVPAGGHLPTMHHVTAPLTLPPLNVTHI